MAKRTGKHSAPLDPGTPRRGAHSAPLDGSAARNKRMRRGKDADDTTPSASPERAITPAQPAVPPVQPAATSAQPATPNPATPSPATLGPATPNPVASQSYSADETLARARAARKKSHVKKVAIGIAAALVIALAGAGTAFAVYLNNLNNTIQIDANDEEFQELREELTPVKEEAEEAEAEDHSYYVAIFGSDARKGETASRSDVTMLARIDPDEGIVHLISVPRDTMIEIEGYGTQKINAAYAFGGPSQAVKTLSTFAGVPITHYVEVHFEELQDVVNELGGIEVYVPERFYSDSSGLTIERGEQTLNGAQALAFARERHATRAGDFSRAQAQRIIIEGIVQKVLDEPLTDIPHTVESLARCVTTDYSVTDLVSLALTFKDSGLTMYSAACPSYTLGRNGVSYAGTQYAEWQDMMRRVDAGLDPTDTSATIPEPQATDTKLGAATNACSPKDYADLAANALTTDDVIQIDETSRTN